MSTVRESVGGLTEAQRTVVRLKTVEAEHRPLDWLEFLGPLLTTAEDTEAERARAGRRLALAWTALFVAWVVTFVAGAIVGAVGGIVGFGLILAALVAIVFTIVQRRRLKRLQLPTSSLRLVLALLPVLAEDAAPGATLGLALDLRGHQAAEKSLGANEPYAKGAYHRVVETFYEDPFLSGRIRFADGADVVLSASVRSRVQRKTKRNPRGKIKTKTKTKCRITYGVAVGFPGRNYAVAEAAPPTAPGGDREKVKATPNRTAVRERRVVKTIGAAPQFEPAHVVDLLAHAYDRVRPARRKKLG